MYASKCNVHSCSCTPKFQLKRLIGLGWNGWGCFNMVKVNKDLHLSLAVFGRMRTEFQVRCLMVIVQYANLTWTCRSSRTELSC